MKAKAKANTATAKSPARSKKIPCPECGVLYTPGVGLASHIRHMHPDAAKGQPGAGKQVITEAAGPQLHLKTALDQLVARKKQIDQEISRQEALAIESREVGQRIEALHIALRSFGHGQKSMTASA